MARILASLDGPMWVAVRELYLQDKVIAALEEAEELGGQDSNDLYAEAEVRQNGTQWPVRPWLIIEAIEAEAGHALSEVRELLAQLCEELSTRFGWDHREKTMITLLPRGAEAAWMPGRWGYFVDKAPYDKICVPYHLAFDHPELTRTVQHEFMHDISTNLSHGKLSRWLSEALSTYAENRIDRVAQEEFRLGQAPWLNPVQLDGLVASDNRNADQHRAISRAYGQANFIGRYLVEIGGESKIGDLLTEIGNESFLTNLESQIRFISRTDAAIRRVYHFTEAELFEKAHAWTLSAPLGAG